VLYIKLTCTWFKQECQHPVTGQCAAYWPTSERFLRMTIRYAFDFAMGDVLEGIMGLVVANDIITCLEIFGSVRGATFMLNIGSPARGRPAPDPP